MSPITRERDAPATLASLAMSAPLQGIADCAVSLFDARFAVITIDRGGETIRGTRGDLPVTPAAAPTSACRSRATQPLVAANGRRFGMLEVFDDREGSISPTQAATLQGLAEVATAMLDQRAASDSVMHRLREAFTQSPSPTWIYDPSTFRFLDVNDAAVRFYGYTREQFLSMTVLDIRPPDERKRMIDAVRDSSDLDAAATWRHRRADGSEVDVITHGRKFGIDGSEAIIAVSIDRTDVLALRKDLSKTQLILDAIIEALPIGLFLKDMQDAGRYLIYNPSIAQTLELVPGHVVGRTDAQVFERRRAEELVAQDRQVMMEGSQRTFEAGSFTTRSGDVRRFRTVKKPLPSRDGTAPRYLLGIAEDITERLKAADRIAHMAMFDALTDLPNRDLFQQHLKRGLSRVRKRRPSR